MEVNPYGISFENLWLSQDKKTQGQVVDLWTSHRLLPPGVDPLKRVQQVVYAIKNEQKDVVGVSTAFPEKIALLRNHVFLFRCFIDENYRIPGLMTKLTIMTREFLESIFEDHQPYCIGMMSIVENKRINQYKNPWYKGGDMVFIGYTQSGQQMRVYYFKGAKLQ